MFERDLPDWARHDEHVQDAMRVLRSPYDDPAKAAALYAIGAAAMRRHDYPAADRMFWRAHEEFSRLREPTWLDRLRGRTPLPPENLLNVERSTYGMRAVVLLMLDRPDEAELSLDHADRLPVPPDDDIGVALPAWRAWVAVSRDRLLTAERSLLELLREDAAAPDPGQHRNSLAISNSARLAQVRIRLGRPEEPVAAMDSVVAAFTQRGDWADLASWGEAVIDAHLAERSLSGARSAAEQLEQATATVTTGAAQHVAQASAHVGVVLAATGELDEALAWLQHALDTSRFGAVEVLGMPLYRGVQLLITARWQRHLSTPRLARAVRGTAWWADALVVPEHVDSLQSVAEWMLERVGRDETSSVLLQVAAKLALLEGREDAAFALLDGAARAAEREGTSPVGVAHDVAMVHLLAGREDDARALVEKSLELVTDGSFEQAGLLHELAAFDARAGSARSATSLYERAAELHTRLEYELDAAECRLNLAVLRGEPVPASFAPFRSGLFEMLWG